MMTLMFFKFFILYMQLKTAVTVGVVGFPNVGKSSLINSLKRTRVASVGATPGVTKAMQEIHLDKHVKLLDCPGIVFAAAGDNEASATLRNCTKIEKLADPVTPGKTDVCYCVWCSGYLFYSFFPFCFMSIEDSLLPFLVYGVLLLWWLLSLV